MKLIKQAHIYTPNDLGVHDILIGEGKILKISKHIDVGNVDVDIINGEGLIATPGFIDGHVHILGGGGEAGFNSRIGPITKADLLEGGVTTVIGLLGTDGYTRSMKDLVAKAKGLKEAGISTYLFTGSYQVPVKTLFDSIEDDILFIEEIIGTGEIAVADHRSSQPSIEALRDTFAKSHVAGLLANKIGITNIHLGKNPGGIKQIIDALEGTGIPINKVLPTHANRNKAILNDAIAYHHSHGLYFDITATGDTSNAQEAVMHAIDKKVSLAHITMTSDGQGSLPIFDDNNTLIDMKVGKVTTLLHTIKGLVHTHNLPLDQALQLVTLNPSIRYNLTHKGELKEGKDADILLLDKDLTIKQIFHQ